MNEAPHGFDGGAFCKIGDAAAVFCRFVDWAVNGVTSGGWFEQIGTDCCTFACSENRDAGTPVAGDCNEGCGCGD